ncbi:Ovarian cancer-associated protein 2 [Linderina pennispora]|nr:Ovarian cancer-associated protein 2 [Linderina pennispora]
MSKFKVLCLHGYTQNAKKFHDRTGPFRRALKNQLDFTYMTAPIQATEFQSDEPTDDGPSAAWWNRKDGKVWQEMQQSMRAIHQTMKEEGPFDAIVGFSQGSGMAAVLLALMQIAKSPRLADMDADVQALAGELGDQPVPKFVMLFAGFYPDLPQFRQIIAVEKLTTPSIHVVGENDHIVPMDRGKQLAEEAFADAVVKTHEGGHFMPSNAAWRKQYQAFLEVLGQ